MPRLVRKDDHDVAIVATKEVVWGVCYFDSFEVDGAGKVEPEYSGGTEVDWDSQQTVTREGKRVFIDENDEELLEDQVEVIDV